MTSEGKWAEPQDTLFGPLDESLVRAITGTAAQPDHGAQRHPDCIFCSPQDPTLNTVIRSRATMYVRKDNFPAAPGHVEIVPFRHISSYFDMSADEFRDLRILSRLLKARLDIEIRADGYTIGVNDGPAAGQTVPHLHFHFIPRWFGDVENPVGGVRRIFPEFDPSAWVDPK